MKELKTLIKRLGKRKSLQKTLEEILTLYNQNIYSKGEYKMKTMKRKKWN